MAHVWSFVVVLGWNLNKPKIKMFYRNMKYQKSTLNLPALAFISAAALILQFVFHFFSFTHTHSHSLSSQFGFYLHWWAIQSVFGSASPQSNCLKPSGTARKSWKLWKWKKTHRERWQLWYMENIKRAESSLVVRGANMIITLYLRSISAVSSLWLLGCAVDMMVILRLRLPFMPFG